MRKAAAVSILTAAILAGSATSSFAGLPSVKNPVIKVPASIAGVKLGMAQDQATKKWGNSGRCIKTGAQNAYTDCEYKKANPELGRAIFGIVPGGGVYTAQISGTPTGETFGRITAGPLLKYKTEEGLGLGDKLSKFERLYPTATQFPAPSDWVIGKVGHTMHFTFSEGDVPRLVAISLFLF